MRKIALSLGVFVLAYSASAQQPVQSAAVSHGCLGTQAVSSKRETKKERKQREKFERMEAKRRAEAAAWEAATRPPDPPYLSSISEEFSAKAVSATLIIDNAFNSMQKDVFSFSAANQSSFERAADLMASARSDGERQVAAILYEYAQRIPVCQQQLRDALQSVLALAVEGGSVRACNNELRRLRAQADRTFDRNRAPVPAISATMTVKPSGNQP